MEGENGRSLEKAFSDKFEAIDQLQDDVKNINGHIIKITNQLTTAYQKIGLVKYDAFKEIGGKLSFVLVLLTEDNNGFIINSMHSTKDGCYTYAKEVVNGEAFVILSEEEHQYFTFGYSSARKIELPYFRNRYSERICSCL